MTIKKYGFLFLILTGFFFLSANSPLPTQENEKTVHIIPIEDRKVFIVDLGLSAFVKRAVKEAEEAKAEAIIIQINTFGGRVDAATEIKDILFNTKIKTISFINKRAISAGALIALACQDIVMAPGATIGAATPVQISPGGGKTEALGEKHVSYVRKEFKATAERNHHPAKLAEAMVDNNVELKLVNIDNEMAILTPEEFEEQKDALGERKVKLIKSDIPSGFAKGKLLTLTTDEAIRLGLVSHKVNAVEEILTLYDLEGASLVKISVNWSENIVRFLTHPVISGLLLTLGTLGLIFELRIPGWGISGTLGLLCLALFFGGQHLVGLAGWIEPILFILGVGLVLLEVLVIPGFGIAGIAGIMLIVISLFLALVKHPLPTFPLAREEYGRALYTIALSFISIIAIILLSLRFIPHTRAWKKVRSKIILTSAEDSAQGYRGTSSGWKKLLGKEGKTLSILRPAGRVIFGKEIVDVVTEGDFINRDRTVKVVKVEGNRIVVAEKEEG